MATTHVEIFNPEMTLYLPRKMTDKEFTEFCRLNREWRIERNAQGVVEIMSPAGSRSGRRNFKLGFLFGEWEEKDGRGLFFDSSTGFKLPNGAERSPDLSWVPWEKWEALTDEEQEGFAPICPDFVLELRSRNDGLEKLKRKMEEWIENGARLGWLFDPNEKRVFVYEPEKAAVCLNDPDTISGDPVLVDFVLNVQKVWASIRRQKR